MTSREILLKKLSSYAFATHELKLFLDTHPNDRETLRKIGEYEETAKKLMKEYEKSYGPIKRRSDNSMFWSWVNDPWPWEE